MKIVEKEVRWAMPIKQLDVDLLPQLRKAGVSAKLKVLSHVLEGNWTSLLKGSGMEFAGFRQYTYGDDASRIDWNASLRAKDVLVREFEEYKTVNVLFVIDVSDSMLLTSTKKLKCEYVAELVFQIGTAIIQAGDGIGYAMFTDHLVAHQYPTISREVIYRMAQDLSNGTLYGGKLDFKRSMLLVRGMLRQRTLIILVSDFLSLPEKWERYVRMFAVDHDLIGLLIRDPLDTKLPDIGMQAIIQDPLNPEQKLLVDLREYAKAYAEHALAHEQYVSSVFEKAKAGFFALDTKKDALDDITLYFRKRTYGLRG